MISHGFKRLSFLLLFTFWFWSVQGLPAQEIDNKLVPNLQPMNDSSPPRDFTLPDQAGNKLSLKDFRGKLLMLNFGLVGVPLVAKRCRQWSAFTKSFRTKVL